MSYPMSTYALNQHLMLFAAVRQCKALLDSHLAIGHSSIMAQGHSIMAHGRVVMHSI